MWWQIFLFLWATSKADEQKKAEIEHFEAMLHDEVARMVRTQTSDLSKPPEFNMPSDFMRSFAPNTGVGNREELIIDEIKELPIFYDANFTQWQYKRFNNSDYLFGVSSRLIVLNKIDSAEDYLVFSKDEAVFNFVPDHKSAIIDTVVFTRSVKRTMGLYIAVLTESTKGNQIHVFEIVGSKGLMVGLITLSSTSASSFEAKKISYVQSQNGGSLVVLISTEDVTEITYEQQGSMEVNHYIEVRYPSAVDMITYTIHGHGYIAVTNSTACQVFKMNHLSKSHLLFDSIYSPFGDLINLDYFRLGFHHYLVVAGKSAQYLYAWTSGEYAWKQRFDIDDTKQVYSSVIPSCRDDVILFFIGENSIEIYVYSGKLEIFIKSEIEIPHNFEIIPGSVTSFTVNNKAVIVFLSKSWTLQAYAIKTSLESVANPILEEGRKVNEYMDHIQDMMKEQNKQIQYIKDVLQNAVRKTGDQVITGFQSFDQLHSSDGTTVERINSTMYVEWDGSDLTLDDYKKGTDWLEQSVIQLEKLAMEIEKIIPDVVRVDEEVDIIGTKRFVGDITGSSILALSINLQSVAGVNLPQLQKEIYRLDKPQKIEGSLTFEKPVTITGNLDIGATVNGIDISEEVMTTDTDQTSRAQMIFENKMVVQGDLDISGTLNGIKVKDEVVTLSGSHVITGKKVFQNGLIAENVQAQIIDGVHINDLYESALTKSGHQEVPGTKTFTGGLETSDILLNGYLNGHNISELVDNIVRIDQPAEITGHKIFLEDVTMESMLTVAGKVNDLRIPDDLFLTDVVQEVPGRKEFMGTVSARDVYVTGTVDGLRIPEDIVTLTGDEEIPSTLYFTDGIDVKGDIIVEGLVDGVDISEVAKQALKLNESSEFEHAIFMGPVTITGDLDVQGTVNNVNLHELVPDIIFKDDPEPVVNSEKHFTTVVADSIILERMLNGFNITVDFMTVHGDQEIYGVKIFNEPVTFNNLNVVDGLIGDLNITHLYENRLSLIIDEEIDRDIEFSDDVIVEGDLVVHGTIGGLKIPEDIVIRSATKTIYNKVFTDTVKVDNLFVNGDVQVSGSFGGVNLEQFQKDRISLTGNHEIDGDLYISNVGIGTLELINGINGVDIVEFSNNVMSKTKPQVIYAPKEFTGTTTVLGKITTKSGVNGYNLADLNERAVKLNKDNVITGHLGFEHITANDITLTGLMNGVDLTDLGENSFKKTGIQHVFGKTVFEHGFHVQGDINAESVNDLVIPEDVLLKSVPQTIKGQFSFGNMLISGDLYVDGYVNGLDLSEIAPQLARIDQETILESNVTFVGPIRILQDIEVSGLVNGIDLNQISDNVLLKSGYQEISGNKILKGNVVIRGDVEVGTVNGIDWQTLISDVVRIDSPQTISAPKTFLGDVEAEDVHSSKTTVEYVNGKSLRKLIDDAVFIDIPANITGRKVFKAPVEISGNLTADLINGLELKKDVITLMCSEGGPQVITGQKTFAKVTAEADINVLGSVNSYNLLDLYHNTLMTEGDQNVSGLKALSNEVVFMNNVYPGTVNGMRLQHDLITLDTDQEIEGPLIFNGDVFVEKDIINQGLINGVDIKKLASDAVYLDSDQVVNGSYFFNKVTVSSDVAVAGTVNGLDLVAFDRNVTDFWTEVSHSLKAVDMHSGDNCHMLQYLQNILSNTYYVLESFVLHEDLKHPASYIQIKPSKELSLVALNEFEPGAIAVSNIWSSDSKSFVPISNKHTTIAKSIIQTVGLTEIDVEIGIYEKDSYVQFNNEVSSLPSGFKEAAIINKGPKEAVIALLFSALAKVEVFRLLNLDSTNIAIENIGIFSIGKDTTSLALFEVSSILHVAVSKYSPSGRGFCKIYALRDTDWERAQTIPIRSKSVKHFVYHGYDYIVFTNNAPVHITREPKSIDIYRNSMAAEFPFFTLFQKVLFDDGKGLEIFEFGDLSELYLATWNETVVQVFRLEGESGLKNTFTLHGRCVKDVKTLTIEDMIYLVVGQQNLKTDEPVHSLLYKGIARGSKLTPHKFTYC